MLMRDNKVSFSFAFDSAHVKYGVYSFCSAVRTAASMGTLANSDSVSPVTANLYMKSFEQKAITTSAYKPSIWKRYVDDIFTILHRGKVDSFLQHVNNQQPSIRFTMETENNYKLASRETDGRLTNSVYRIPCK